MSKYTINIASLKATAADIQQLDAKNVLLNGKDISDHVSDVIADTKTDIIDQVNETIDENKTDLLNTIDATKTDIIDQVNETIDENKIVVLDERGTLANDALDIWNSSVTKDANNNVIINTKAKPFLHTYDSISSEQTSAIKSAVKVVDNEVLGSNDEHIMYWLTDGLTNGGCVLVNCNDLIIFSSNLFSLTDGHRMFENCARLTTFISTLPSLTYGPSMFWKCEDLVTFTSDLPNLTDGSDMFSSCIALTSFSSSLHSLMNGSGMFHYCYRLKSFSSDLPNLTDGSYMFRTCTGFTTFSSTLFSLIDGTWMFYGCHSLTSFSSDLPSLTKGNGMFHGCSRLTSFTSNLSSLEDGFNMFYNCKLDAPSVANIIHFILQRDTKPTSTEDNGNITIGLGIANTDEAKQAFAEECDCADWEELNKEFDDKNWAVQWLFNGPVSYSLRDTRPSTAVYTKLEEVIAPTEEEIASSKEKREHIQIPHYQYTSQDGSKFYNIHWYHDSNTNNDGYDHFESLEEAISTYNVILKV